MLISRSIQQLNIDNGIELRAYYESLRSQLDTEFSSWRDHYRLLARFVLPRQQRFNYSDVDNGKRLDLSIVDNSATLALRTLGAGLMSGTCTPTRTWFSLLTNDDKLNKQRDVKMWLETVEDILRKALLRSNFYQTAHGTFRELGLYGTSAYQILEDEKDDVRCYPWPIGSYYLSGDDTNRIDLQMRIVQMTVRQIVDKFGYANCSSAVQSLYDSNAGGVKEQWFPIVNVIHRNKYYGEQVAAKFKPWVSVWYEMGQYGNIDVGSKTKDMGCLRRGGFDENPNITPRWDVIGEDFYGVSPGMDALGDTMSLQWLQKRKSAAIDKMVNPPMVASPTMVNKKMSILPGDVTFVDTRENGHGFKPAFEIKYDISASLEDIREHKGRIDESFYKNLFLMLAGDERNRQVTAEEIRARQEEKMLVLGPVLERSNGEFLEPTIFRYLAILGRKGKIPPPPEALRGKMIRVEFTSILARAQKMLGVANIERFLGLVGNEAAVNQGIFDIVDLDESARLYADLLNVPASMIRDQEMVDAIRARKERQMLAQQQAENAQKMAMAAKNLSETDTTNQNGLTDLIRGQTGI